ncbi:MAG: tandem-95 repeat protein [Geminicoccaceae bacterium]|nr:tandem-95 repeat protein [Geminicoccaceae bacterium]
MAAVDDRATTNEDTPVTTNVIANDRDPAGGIARLEAIVTPPESGLATINQTQGTITYRPGADFNGSDSIVYRSVDSSGNASTATLAISVTAVNDLPEALNDTATTTEDTAVSVAVLANDTDVDGDALRITGVSAGANGTARISGSEITFTPKADFTGSEDISYTISDGKGGTAQAVLRIEVTAVNDAPVATADSATTTEDTPVVIEVVANDTDVDGDALKVDAVTIAPANGTAAVSGAGTITYTPNENFNGTDKFTYQVTDGAGGLDTAEVTVRVNPGNDAPVAADDAATMAEDGKALKIPVLANDTDIDGDRLTVTAIGNEATLGTATIAKGGITYTPFKDATGTDTFTYTVSDPSGATSTATVTVEITPVNDAPTAVDDTATTAEDTLVTISPLANDSDVDGDQVSVTAVGAARLGTVVLDGDTLTYTPNENAHGTDRFTYTISDGDGDGALTSTATVTVTIDSVNDAPVANADTATTTEDRALAVNVIANDTDADGDRLTVTGITAAPANGTAEIVNNQIRYTPNADFNGEDTLTYSVDDGQGGTAEAVLTIQVSPLNDAPVAVADEATTDEDTAVAIDVLANDSDVDGDALTVTTVGGARLGTVAIAEDGSSLTYTPKADANGTDTFTYTVGDGAARATATVTVTVNPVNDAPVAANDVVTTAEDTVVMADVLRNDSDTDSPALQLGRIVEGPTNGTAEIDGGIGQIRYTPNENYNGPDSLVYEVTDGELTTTARLDITVKPVNDAPEAMADAGTTAEDAAVLIDVLGNDTDLDGDALRVASVVRPGNGTAVIDAETGQVRYTPNADFNGEDSFTYTVSDGAGGTAVGTVTVTVEPVNDAPVATADRGATVEDTAVLLDVLSNDTDIDLDTLTVASVAAPANGTAEIEGGQIRYTPNENFNGEDSFTYTASDGAGGTAEATVTVQVTPGNDAPVATADAVTTKEDTAATFDVLANDSDVDGDALRVTAVGEAGNGTTAISGNKIVYTPNENFNGEDSFTYTIADPAGETSEATVTVAVQSINDRPVAVDDSFEVAAGTRRAPLNVLANDSDIDSNLNTQSVQISEQPDHGQAFARANGEIDYYMDPGFVGTDTLVYSVGDSGGFGSNTAKVTINVVAPPSEGSAIALDDVLGGEEISVATSEASAPVAADVGSAAGGAGSGIDELVVAGNIA